MPPKPQKTTAAGRLIGYARISTEEQGTDPQRDELQAAGCATILEDYASGADRSWPILARLLGNIVRGERSSWCGSTVSTARSVHLLAVITFFRQGDYLSGPIFHYPAMGLAFFTDD